MSGSLLPLCLSLDLNSLTTTNIRSDNLSSKTLNIVLFNFVFHSESKSVLA